MWQLWTTLQPLQCLTRSSNGSDHTKVSHRTGGEAWEVVEQMAQVGWRSGTGNDCQNPSVLSPEPFHGSTHSFTNVPPRYRLGQRVYAVVSGPLLYPTRLLFGPTPVYFVHSRHTGSLPTSWSCNPSVRGWHSVLLACLPTGVVQGSSINDDCARSIERLDEGESTEVESRQDAVHVDRQGTNARQNWSGWDSHTVSWRAVPDIRQRLGSGVGWEPRHGWTDW